MGRGRVFTGAIGVPGILISRLDVPDAKASDPDHKRIEGERRSVQSLAKNEGPDSNNNRRGTS